MSTRIQLCAIFFFHPTRCRDLSNRFKVVFERQNDCLNETVVYSDDAIRPVFLITFWYCTLLICALWDFSLKCIILSRTRRSWAETADYSFLQSLIYRFSWSASVHSNYKSPRTHLRYHITLSLSRVGRQVAKRTTCVSWPPPVVNPSPSMPSCEFPYPKG